MAGGSALSRLAESDCTLLCECDSLKSVSQAPVQADTEKLTPSAAKLASWHMGIFWSASYAGNESVQYELYIKTLSVY